VLSLRNNEENAHNISHNNFEQNCEQYHMTAREKDIAKLICSGQQYRKIGERLFISEKTVRKHVQNIFEKLDVSNKIELVNKLETKFRSAS
jgi:DNA-binding NarL/FixJ family response regulator